MPNSFTVFPNVLPGNVTIGGNLTVGGDQLRIGAATPYVRLGKDANADLLLSQNLGFDNATLDVAATTAIRQSLRVASLTEAIRRINAAGTVQDKALIEAIFSDYTAHVHTGTTTTDTIYSKTIPANTLGANGAIRLRFAFNVNAQGATAAVVQVLFGATNLGQFNISATGQDSIFEITIANRNATNAQFAEFWRMQFAANTTQAGNQSGAVDTTADQVLTVKATNGATTDSQTFNYAVAHQLNSFGPV